MFFIISIDTTVWCLMQKRFVGMLNDSDCWKTKLGKEKMGSLAALGRKVNGFMRRNDIFLQTPPSKQII